MKNGYQPKHNSKELLPPNCGSSVIPPQLTRFVPMPPIKPAKHKTNRQWLLSLSNKDLTMLILGGITDFARQSISSQSFIEEWLDNEYDEEYAKMAFPYLECWRNKKIGDTQ